MMQGSHPFVRKRLTVERARALNHNRNKSPIEIRN